MLHPYINRHQDIDKIVQAWSKYGQGMSRGSPNGDGSEFQVFFRIHGRIIRMIFEGFPFDISNLVSKIASQNVLKLIQHSEMIGESPPVMTVMKPILRFLNHSQQIWAFPGLCSTCRMSSPCLFHPKLGQDLFLAKRKRNLIRFEWVSACQHDISNFFWGYPIWIPITTIYDNMTTGQNFIADLGWLGLPQLDPCQS